MFCREIGGYKCPENTIQAHLYLVASFSSDYKFLSLDCTMLVYQAEKSTSWLNASEDREVKNCPALVQNTQASLSVG